MVNFVLLAQFRMAQKRKLHGLWNALRPPASVHQRCCHPRFKQAFLATPHFLRQLDARAGKFDEAGFDLEQVVNGGGFQEITHHAPYHEICFSLQLMVMNTDETQAIRPPALTELQKVCMIDRAGKIRVFVIDPKCQNMG